MFDFIDCYNPVVITLKEQYGSKFATIGNNLYLVNYLSIVKTETVCRNYCFTEYYIFIYLFMYPELRCQVSVDIY